MNFNPICLERRERMDFEFTLEAQVMVRLLNPNPLEFLRFKSDNNASNKERVKKKIRNLDYFMGGGSVRIMITCSLFFVPSKHYICCG